MYSLITVTNRGHVQYARGFPTEYLAGQARSMALTHKTMEDDAQQLDESRTERLRREARRAPRAAFLKAMEEQVSLDYPPRRPTSEESKKYGKKIGDFFREAWTGKTLTVSEEARALGVEELSVTQWIGDDGLVASKLNHSTEEDGSRYGAWVDEKDQPEKVTEAIVVIEPNVRSE